MIGERWMMYLVHRFVVPFPVVSPVRFIPRRPSFSPLSQHKLQWNSFGASRADGLHSSSKVLRHMRRFKRRQYFVDPKVQGALVLRLLGYWTVTIVTVTAMVLCWRIATTPSNAFYSEVGDMWFHYGAALVASLLLLPLIVLDCVRMSNRFAGPLYRMRRCLRDLSAGLPVPPIHFREGDFWMEVADEFNAVSAKLQRLEMELAEARGQDPFDDESFPLATAAQS